MNRAPTHPGEILKLEFFRPMKITQKELAKKLKFDIKVVNRLFNKKTSVTPLMSIRLSKLFKTSAEFWMNSQVAWDLYMTRKEMKKK